MAPVAPEPAPAPTSATPGDRGGGLFRISLDTYRRMGEAGLTTREDRVVLLDGLLVKELAVAGFFP